MRIFAFLPRFQAGRLAGPAAACGVLAALASPVPAAPLDKNACAKLALDLQNLKALDVGKLMEKGPAWAASHLSPADLSLVRQYIDLDEQMKFRCSAPSSLVHLKHLEDEEEDGGQAKTAATGEAKKAQSGDGEQDTVPSREKRKTAQAPAKAKQPQRSGGR